MRTAAKLMTLMVITVLLNTEAVPGFTIKLQEKIKLSQEKTMLGNPISFCVTKDELFIVPDYKLGNIKIYDGKGKLLNVLGRKGFGPKEYVEPASCFYSKEGRKFGVLDFGMRKIFIHERTGKKDFKRFKDVPCLALGTDIKLKGNKLLIAGYKADNDGNPYALYYIDISTDEKTLLLPAYYKYGFESFREFKAGYLRKPNIKAIGIKGWFDIQGDDVYFVWEGDLKIIKLKIEPAEKEPIFFGNKTTNYIKPYATKKLIEAYQKGDIKSIRGEKEKMSYVRTIFACPKYVLVIFGGPVKPNIESNFWVQFYALDGTFREEVPIPGPLGYSICFDKDRNILYTITSDSSVDDLDYFILKYQIREGT